MIPYQYEQTEAEGLRALLKLREDDVNHLGTLLAEVIKERDEARAWVERMQKEQRILTCVYCGQAYPPGTPTSGTQVLTDHIKVCNKHPMRVAEQRIAALEKALRSLLCACDNASLPHDVRGSCISPNMAMCMTDCRTALAGGKE